MDIHVDIRGFLEIHAYAMDSRTRVRNSLARHQARNQPYLGQTYLVF